MAAVKDLHEKWMQNESYRKAHRALEPEFALARAAIGAHASGNSVEGKLSSPVEVEGDALPLARQ